MYPSLSNIEEINLKKENLYKIMQNEKNGNIKPFQTGVICEDIFSEPTFRI